MVALSGVKVCLCRICRCEKWKCGMFCLGQCNSRLRLNLSSWWFYTHTYTKTHLHSHIFRTRSLLMCQIKSTIWCSLRATCQKGSMPISGSLVWLVREINTQAFPSKSKTVTHKLLCHHKKSPQDPVSPQGYAAPVHLHLGLLLMSLIQSDKVHNLQPLQFPVAATCLLEFLGFDAVIMCNHFL